jgi:hypothetical protein
MITTISAASAAVVSDGRRSPGTSFHSHEKMMTEKNRREEWKERRKEEREAWKEWEKDRREAWKEREKARRESEKEWDKLHRDD